MKKILVVTLSCLFLLTGVKKTNLWEKTVQLSEFTIEDNYAKGEIKNLTDKAYNATITLELKSGDLTKEDVCYETIKPNEIRKVSCILNDNDDKYTVNIKNVELEEFPIPALDSELSIDALKYHFEDIYDATFITFFQSLLIMKSINCLILIKLNIMIIQL